MLNSRCIYVGARVAQGCLAAVCEHARAWGRSFFAGRAPCGSGLPGKKSGVPFTLEQDGALCLIHLDGEINIAHAAQLKQLLVEALKMKKNMQLDVEQVTDLDITALQLLWAADREAKKLRLGLTVTGRIPDEIAAAAVDAGFEGFPITAEAIG